MAVFVCLFMSTRGASLTLGSFIFIFPSSHVFDYISNRAKPETVAALSSPITVKCDKPGTTATLPLPQTPPPAIFGFSVEGKAQNVVRGHSLSTLDRDQKWD